MRVASVRAFSQSQRLRHIFSEGHWSYHKSELGSIANLQLVWNQKVDCFGLLSFHKPCWKFLWKAKDSAEIRVGLGSALKLLKSQASDLEAFGDLRFYGGIQFPSSREQMSFGKVLIKISSSFLRWNGFSMVPILDCKSEFRLTGRLI